jgi:endonuclease/exonuclease/phosphatase (EEP) superfamily protein YafD
VRLVRGSSVCGRLTFARWLALGVLAAANVGLLIAAADGSGAFAAIIAPLTGHLIGLGLAASLALLARRRRLVVLGTGVAATVVVHALLGLARCCEPAASTANPQRATSLAMPSRPNLSILTLNTWYGHSDPERLAHYLATAPADIVVLSELAPNKQSLLDTLRTVYPYQVDCVPEGHCSLAMLSRNPFAAAGAAYIAAGKPAFVWAKVGGAPDGVVTIIGTQLSQPGRDPRLHAVQMTELARFIQRIDGPLLLTGDLNTTPWSYSFRMLRTMTGLVPTSMLMPSWPAWPIALPQVALDHILLSSELAVTAAGTGPAVGSDHLPVWAYVTRRSLAIDHHRLPFSGSRLAAAGLHLRGKLFAHLGSEQGRTRDLSW